MPLGAKLEKWWKEYGLKPEREEWIKWVEIYSQMMLEKAKEMSTAHEHKNDDGDEVLGMSKSVGCTKAELLKLAQVKEGIKEESGSARWTWFLGHSVEIGVLATLACLGYELKTQYEVESKYKTRKSASDAMTTYFGKPALISVKSAGYKMSGGKRNKKTNKYTFVRRGFASLPFEGIKFSEHSWWVQLQMEMYAAGVDQGIIIVAAKDMVKAYENDEWLNDRNGSLSFYAQYFKAEPTFAAELESKWNSIYKEFKDTGQFGSAMYLNKYFNWVELVQGDYDPDNIWGGENQSRTGTFNICGGCVFQPICPSIRSTSDLHN